MAKATTFYSRSDGANPAGCENIQVAENVQPLVETESVNYEATRSCRGCGLVLCRADQASDFGLQSKQRGIHENISRCYREHHSVDRGIVFSFDRIPPSHRHGLRLRPQRL